MAVESMEYELYKASAPPPDPPVALVTGATGELGRAVCRLLARAGFQVVGVARRPERAADEFEALAAFVDAPPVLVAADVTKYGELLEALAPYGPVDAVVTCAGVSAVAPVQELTPAAFSRVIAVNLVGTFNAVKAALEHARRGDPDGLRVVTVGSIHGCTPTSYPHRSAYTASKGGVAALTRALAVELAPAGAAVNCVAPGHLPVLMAGTNAAEDLLRAAEARTPTGSLTFTIEVAEVVRWLVTEAPGNLTGQVIVVDGGFTIDTFPFARGG